MTEQLPRTGVLAGRCMGKAAGATQTWGLESPDLTLNHGRTLKGSCALSLFSPSVKVAEFYIFSQREYLASPGHERQKLS